MGIYYVIVFSRIKPGSTGLMFLKGGTRKGYKGGYLVFHQAQGQLSLYILYQFL